MPTIPIRLSYKTHAQFTIAKESLGLTWDEYFEAVGILGIAMANCTEDMFMRILEILKEGNVRTPEQSSSEG